MEAAVTAATTDVAALGPHIISIGSAIIALAVIALGIRWIKATFF